MPKKIYSFKDFLAKIDALLPWSCPYNTEAAARNHVYVSEQIIYLNTVCNILNKTS